ncbi:hypothetical protein PR003_g25747 [Phytophthora rubi]|uniref:Fcf2 pre-rRNA processing C-terminal domain-containing protein n=1 Tax=Phytophthora rubi TaxID=129364 RepID=A0A6A3MC94_9STRA|nr:hypothetical protein PR002_g11070 [Phytophthora rubi]KAE9031647.1 hypothetical protein PR001_g10975 [Phytophthora rubi]KAE9288683.1 hypothetical protein PR003_g25747 [Phytophthora rubi]
MLLPPNGSFASQINSHKSKMVETRTSRRLQAKAAGASPSPSPMNSPAGRSPSPSTRRSRRTPSPRGRAKKQEETAQEIPLELSDEDEKKEEKKQEKQQQEVILIGSETESEEHEVEKKQEQEKTQEEEKEAPAAVEEKEVVVVEEKEEPVQEEKDEEEEEIMLLDDDEEEEGEEKKEEGDDEEDDDDEDVDQYAFLAASGLNLSTKTSVASSTVSTTSAAVKPSAAAALKRRLVPNQLDSGASHYQEFFNFDGSRRSTAATLRADACAAEEAKVLAAGQKEVAHSERQRAESQHKKSAGRRWFNFESDEMTDDARRDFQLLRMRNYLDPKKFYKSSDHARGLPKHFQMGVVVEGAHEFHSARLTKKQRRKTFTDEIMADEAVVQYTHRVASNIQAARANTSRKKRRRN